MAEYLGIDTSNYTTSASIFDSESMQVKSLKKMLPVKEGELGLRQSDAVFHHTRQLPELLEELLPADIKAIGVSTRPRSVDGSYMPCFLTGETVARAISSFVGLKLYRTSHQIGHILAAMYSAQKLNWIKNNKGFIAFHVSGGTTDCLFVEPDSNNVIKVTELASSLDLKAGQAIDRTGVMLGLKFPCGQELEKLAMTSDAEFKFNIKLQNGSCNLSGLENICKKMVDKGEKHCDVARYCIEYIGAVIEKMTEYALTLHAGSNVLYAGGVMSDQIIKDRLSKRFKACFAEPALSSDNACGVAVFAAIKDGLLQ